jgi:uncharacterized repeat protein (TIGR02543 family)
MNKTSFYFLITFLCMAFIGCNGMAELFHGPKPETLTYTVTFNANGGSGTVPARTGIEGTSIILPDGSGLSKSGFAFDGWNTNTSGTGVNYNAGSSYTITGNITLYARWIMGYTVTFDANGGSGTVPARTGTEGTSIILPEGSGFSRSGYTFDGWNTNASGTGTNYNAGTLYTVNGNTTLYAKWKMLSYEIGDIGPAGGIVFYDAGAVINGWRYLEASPTNISAEVQWGAYGYDVSGTGMATGDGKQNTQLIVARLNQLGETGRAAQLCANLNINGFNDWFLPSLYELDLMYKNLKQNGLGNFSNDAGYWSSSQYSTGAAWIYFFNFDIGYEANNYTKDSMFFVRAVRAFAF